MSTQAIPLYDLDGKETEKVNLDPEVFDGEINFDLIYHMKLMYEANLRRGNASTKTRGNVRGGGKKPWKQKGTGRARAGSTRSPIWRGGGTTFGPLPRSYYYRLPRKMLRSALKIEPKTKLFAKILKKLKLTAKILLVVKDIDAKVTMASRNIDSLTVKDIREVNALDILNNSKLVLTKDALSGLITRIKK
ncbi:MAG: 50S ribosomal protein L4 [Candidatus Omnitrophica bacterium]|nr:50S ribosomal protein L4 [Candidatus Omnitrophota bacterium]